jgi:uncharacterized protein YjbJ (UPF0337 family)
VGHEFDAFGDVAGNLRDTDIRPFESVSGDSVTEMLMSSPSLRNRTVSKCSMCSPREIRVRKSTSSGRRSGGNSTVMGADGLADHGIVRGSDDGGDVLEASDARAHVRTDIAPAWPCKPRQHPGGKIFSHGTERANRSRWHVPCELVAVCSRKFGETAKRGGGDMNRDTLKGQWTQLKGQVRKQWGKLTDDEIDQIQGDAEILMGKLQQRYGYTREQAEREMERWELERKAS